MSFPYEVTLQSMRDIQNQAPNAICEMTPTPVAMNLLVNRDACMSSKPPPSLWCAGGDVPRRALIGPRRMDGMR
jgi:hypothetical protein